MVRLYLTPVFFFISSATRSSLFTPPQGYAIPTIGKAADEIACSIRDFIDHAKKNPDLRFHVRPLGYNKAGYSVEQIAHLFAEAIPVGNILLPKEIVDLNQ